MFVRKPPVASPPAEPYQKQLEDLYARRTAIDTLIRSLVDYDRLRVQGIETFEEKTA